MIRYNGEYHPETIRYMSRVDLKRRTALGQFFTPKSVREELLRRLPRLGKSKQTQRQTLTSKSLKGSPFQGMFNSCTF